MPAGAVAGRILGVSAGGILGMLGGALGSVLVTLAWAWIDHQLHPQLAMGGGRWLFDFFIGAALVLGTIGTLGGGFLAFRLSRHRNTVTHIPGVHKSHEVSGG
jgi:hypothetical protein